jgi:hypothetical protein
MLSSCHGSATHIPQLPEVERLAVEGGAFAVERRHIRLDAYHMIADAFNDRRHIVVAVPIGWWVGSCTAGSEPACR